MEQHVDIFMYILCIEGDSHQIIEEDSDEDVELHACSGQGSSGQGHNDPFSTVSTSELSTTYLHRQVFYLAGIT